MTIAILDDYQNAVRTLECFELLRDYETLILTETYSEDVLVEKLAEVDALVLIRERTQITESLLARLPKLKVISQTGKVSNHIDVELCKRYGVEVVEGIGSPIAPSELCWALILSASRHIPAYVSHFQQGHWQQSGELGLGRSLHGLTLGIWGYGKIGQRIAKYASAFEMKVLVWGSDASRQKAIDDGHSAARTKHDFFVTSDIVTLHLRLNDATRACVTEQDLRAMKSDASLVNTSRADLIEHDALYKVMASEPTKRAAVDVFEHEPATPAIEPLLTLPNVLSLPHLGYVERNSYEIYFKAAFENVVAYLKNQQAG